MRRKVVTRIETETGAVGTSVVCYLLRAGAALTTGGATSVPANSTATVRVRHPGALKLNDRVYWLATNGVVSGSFQINAAPTYNAGGYWEIVLLDLSGSTTAIGTTGDLVLQWAESGHWVTWYDTDTGGTGTSGVISPSATTGALSFYVDVPDLDVAVVSGGTLSAYFRDLSVEQRSRVSVTEFGAVGDGVTDNSGAFKAAIYFAAENDAAVYVPAGTYLFSSTIGGTYDAALDGKTVVIEGEGMGVSILQANYHNAEIWRAFDLAKLVLRGLTFVGDEDDEVGTGAQRSTGIGVVGDIDFHVSECEFKNFGSDGIRLGVSTQSNTVPRSALIYGCRFDNNARGSVVITACDSAVIANNWIGPNYPTTTSGIVESCVNIEENNDAYLIRNVVITGNVIEGGLECTEVPQSAGGAGMRVSITGNVILGRSGSDDTVAGVAPAIICGDLHELEFTGNYCYNRFSGTPDGDQPAFTFRTIAAVISGNTFDCRDGKADQVLRVQQPTNTAPDNAESVIISNNRVIGDAATTTDSGIYALPGANDGVWLIDGNTVRDFNGNYGIDFVAAAGLTNSQAISICNNIIDCDGQIARGIRVIQSTGTVASTGIKSVLVANNVLDGATYGVEFNNLDNWRVSEVGNQYLAGGTAVAYTNGSVPTTHTLWRDLDLNGYALTMGGGTLNMESGNITNVGIISGLDTHVSWAGADLGLAGTHYVGGYYLDGATANDFNPSITLGTANKAYGAHVYFVAAAGATDTQITVTGTSITDAGVRAAADTEVISLSNGAANSFYQTTKRWIGQVTIQKTAGTDRLCNYGFVKHWDNYSRDFTVSAAEATWLANANDTSFNVELMHHKATGWTYNAGSPATKPTPILSLQTIYNTEYQLSSGEEGGIKRSGIAVAVNGDTNEGVFWRITTGSANSLAYINFDMLFVEN